MPRLLQCSWFTGRPPSL
ncbi:hypothetical protein EYF80_067863 [Liparis tanakae]|uniref:Uncharacterized protein n=1 Tax=Liparis tanakae TaxID=230148 RepID=A0A4Z2DZS9_9TELE|nr:hypothetical protein EYF80_067863 [Liparis tanakae]